MEFKLHVRCECGNEDIIVPLRTLVEFEGKTYEDHTSITDGVTESNTFKANQSHADYITITCKCGICHALTT